MEALLEIMWRLKPSRFSLIYGETTFSVCLDFRITYWLPRASCVKKVYSTEFGAVFLWLWLDLEFIHRPEVADRIEIERYGNIQVPRSKKHKNNLNKNSPQS